MKSEDDVHIVDFEKERDIQEISRILRQQADLDFIRALSEILQDRFATTTHHDPLIGDQFE